jgi:hypothetical protein
MKLLFENWRKFALVESEEQSLGSLEKKYLGIDSDTITQIGNDLVDMRHRPFALIKLHMVDKYGINLNKPQSGAFRTTYQITDDIVRLLSDSSEALQDFAYIKSQQDVNAFNVKYGVNLVLPRTA